MLNGLALFGAQEREFGAQEREIGAQAREIGAQEREIGAQELVLLAHSHCLAHSPCELPPLSKALYMRVAPDESQETIPMNHTTQYS